MKSAASVGAASEQALQDVRGIALVVGSRLRVLLCEADATISRLEAACLKEHAEIQELSRSLASSAAEAQKTAAEVIKLRKQVCLCTVCSLILASFYYQIALPFYSIVTQS